MADFYPRLRKFLLLLAATVVLSACEIPFLGDDTAQKALLMETEGKAIGGACRHALRGVEDCYTLNATASKSAVFAGWKDMDQYMRENKLDGMPAVVPKPAAKTEEVVEEEEPEPPPKKAKPGAKPAAKH